MTEPLTLGKLLDEFAKFMAETDKLPSEISLSPQAWYELKESLVRSGVLLPMEDQCTLNGVVVRIRPEK